MIVAPEHLTADIASDGYMLRYKGQPIGGVGTILHQRTPNPKRHWTYERADRQMYAAASKREIDKLVKGTGMPRFIEAIRDIDAVGDAPVSEYAFDVNLRAIIRVEASSAPEAAALLCEHLDAADCNAGAWPDGSPILFEASMLRPVRLPNLIEIDGEAV